MRRGDLKNSQWARLTVVTAGLQAGPSAGVGAAELIDGIRRRNRIAADWPSVGDWERVTTDLLHLVRCGDCDALSLGLPAIARALVCTGPHSHVRVHDPAADDVIAYGPTERATVLAEVCVLLNRLASQQPLWPGDGLVPRDAGAPEGDGPVRRGPGRRPGPHR